MKAYMSHYLAEIDENTIPPGVIVSKSKKEIFDQFLGSKKIANIVVCVHGFNVHFHDAQTWFGILTDSLRKTDELDGKIITDPIDQDKVLLKKSKDGTLTAFIGFSWPSNGNAFSYPSDQTEAIGSASILANLITRIRELPNKPSVNLICHSMGNFLACHMFRQLINKVSKPIITSPDTEQGQILLKNRLNRLTNQEKKGVANKDLYFVDRYVMLAPDVERRHVTKCVEDVNLLGRANEQATYVGPFYSGLSHIVGEVHNFYSRFDGALAISNIEKGPRKLMGGAKGVMDQMSFGIFDFLERNPDQKWEQRLGATQHPINAPYNMTSHNAVELSGREIGHSDYIDSHEIAIEIAKILTSKLK